MNNNTLEIILFIFQVALLVVSFFLGKFLPANKLQKIGAIADIVSDWAEKFVHAARQFRENETGEQKMNYVINELEKIATENGWKISTEQLRAAAQAAYDKMKKEDNK